MITRAQLATIYSRYRPVILRWLEHCMGQSRADAEDILHHSIIIFQERFTPGRPALPFLEEICKKRMYHLARLRQSRAAKAHYIQGPQVDPCPLETIIETRCQASNRRAVLGDCTGRAYTVCRLALDDHPIAEISQLTGLAPRAVMHILRKNQT
jgi:DNA-directed RNA polymerase specialized sigma24 family protein